MRHATDEDLDCVGPLLEELRGTPGLRERKRGSFSRGSRAFLHFHADAGDVYVDVRLEGRFQRVKVTSRAEQTELMSMIRGVVTTDSEGHER